MTKETFNEGFKLFKRFLKEQNLYKPVMNFLFQHGRKKENLFKEFNNKNYPDVDDWTKVFDRTNLLTGYLYNFNFDAYCKLIDDNNLSRKWKIYYYNEYINKND